MRDVVKNDAKHDEGVVWGHGALENAVSLAEMVITAVPPEVAS